MTQKLWYQDSGPSTAPRPEWLAIPTEWNFEEKERAYEELDEARLNFSSALDEFFELVHRLS